MSSSDKCDPRRPIPLWLDCFDSAPESQRPTFVYRRTTAAEFERLVDGITPPDGADDGAIREWNRDLRRSRIYELLLIGLLELKNHVDLETNQPITGDITADVLRRIINAEDADELLNKRLNGGQLTAAEKKGYVSQNCGGTGECAASAE